MDLLVEQTQVVGWVIASICDAWWDRRSLCTSVVTDQSHTRLNLAPPDSKDCLVALCRLFRISVLEIYTRVT